MDCIFKFCPVKRRTRCKNVAFCWALFVILSAILAFDGGERLSIAEFVKVFRSFL